MLTLRQAIKQNRLSEFVAEHSELRGDMNAFNRTVEAMAGKSEEAHQTSDRDGSDD